MHGSMRPSSCERRAHRATMQLAFHSLARLPMSATGPNQSLQPAVSDKQLAMIVDVLYLVAYVVGVTGLIGVIIAHVKIGSADPLLRTPYPFQIRTFL